MSKLGKSKYDHLIWFQQGGCVSLRYMFHTFKCLLINGRSVNSIWCPCDTTKDVDVVRARGWRFSCDNLFHDVSGLNQIGYLPVEIQNLMGKQNINGKDVLVRHISFITEPSGHACANSLAHIYTDKGHFYIEYDDYGMENRLSINHPYVLKWLELFGKNITAEFISNPHWQFKKFLGEPQDDQGTCIKRINDEYFPVYQSSSWRKHWEYSYKEYDNFSRVKVFDQNENSIYLLNKKDKSELEVGDNNLIFIPRQHIGGSAWHHLRITNNNRTYDLGLSRFTIDKVGSKIMAHHNYSKGSDEYSDGDFYQIYSKHSLITEYEND
jgi:hypothetical protein